MSTKIEWVKNPDGTKGETWNPVTGCTKVSEGCRFCYAERMAKRLAGRYGYPADEPFRVTLHPDRLEQPLHWRKPRRVFVCSMSDLFHEDVPIDFIWRVWFQMQQASLHTFQVLTKRPKRMRDFLANDAIGCPLGAPQNLWLGVTAENQEAADKRIPLLLQTPAAVRFVSIEPMLERVDLGFICLECNKYHHYYELYYTEGGCPTEDCEGGYYQQYKNLDWVIVGGETGPGARPMDPAWVRDIRKQCQAAHIPFFFKSWGAWIPADQMNAEERAAAKRSGYSHIPELVHWQEFCEKLPDRDKRVHIWPDGSKSFNVGKKLAGCLLDERTWEEMPRA